jgi:hypothetical protein
MRFGIDSHLLRKAALWIAPVALLGGASVYAQDHDFYQGYNFDDYNHATRHHQRYEKHALKDHQREERYYYGNSWELRQHQREERHGLKHHQRDERDDRYYNRDGYSNRDSYYSRDGHNNRDGYSNREGYRDGYYNRGYDGR